MMDWPTTVAEFERILGHHRTRKSPGLKGSNIMTPEWLGHVYVKGTPVEITTGIGMSNNRIFGVTFPNVGEHELPNPANKLCFSLDEVLEYLYPEEVL